MKELILIRHGATAGNLARRYIGRTDEPLCGEGVAQARALAAEAFATDTVLVSPALRARQTAELLFPGLPARVVPGLMECDFGVFENKTADELADDPAYRAWVEGQCLGPIPGGEGVDSFKARVCAAFRKEAEALPEGCRAAMVTHGGCIMAILEACASPARAFYDCHVDNCGWVRCRYENRSLQITGGTLC